MSSVRFGPFNDVFDLQRGVKQFLDTLAPTVQCEVHTKAEAAVWRPAVDIHEDENAFVIDAELPGLTREDVAINFQDGNLTISGERRYAYEKKEETNEGEENKAKNRNRVERFYGRFFRRFKLPATIDPESIRAKFEAGILTITVPKAPVVKPRQIEIG